MKKIWLLISLFVVLCVGTVKAAYVDEYPESYTRSYKNWITTMDTMGKANMYGEITRIELSKMISNYAINILKKKPDTSKKCEFSDVSDRSNIQYDSWVVNSCQLWLMWQWISNFRPYDKVTRAEFGTILSRLLWWDKYNGWNPYYKKHVNQLTIRWIMNNTKNTEKINESRGNVMVMLKRSETLWNLKIPSFEELDDVVTMCEYENVFWEEWDTYRENITKQKFIIPYKDWYIWYDYWWNWEWWGYHLTYKSLDNPCEIISQTDEIFFWYTYYKHYKDLFNDDTYTDSKLYIAEWWWSWIPIDIIAKDLDCKAWEDPNDVCKKEVDKFMYNLIIWEEENEYFTQWMDKFKKDIDNNEFKNYSFWQENWKICSDKIEKEIEQQRNSLNWENIEKLRSKKINKCIVEYLKN